MIPLEWDGERAPLAKALVAAQKASESRAENKIFQAHCVSPLLL